MLCEKRFIPTRVGNAFEEPYLPCAKSVHPHASGECYITTPKTARDYGSSPREWGMHDCQPCGLECRRFIPTRVGNALQAAMREQSITVHPHASGECHVVHASTFAGGGSSPREWGMPARMVRGDVVSRFIPTRVGNALVATWMRPLEPVHPHASGECPASRHARAEHHGSSPREWGMLCRLSRPNYTGRFIPTRVGNAAGRQVVGLMLTVHPHASGECLSSLGY